MASPADEYDVGPSDEFLATYGDGYSDTGKNDPNSIWGGLGSFLTGATGAVQTLTKKPAKPAKAAPMPAWLIPVAIGAVLLVVFLSVLKK